MATTNALRQEEGSARLQRVHGIEGSILQILRKQGTQEANLFRIKLRSTVKDNPYPEFLFRGDLQYGINNTMYRLQYGNHVIVYSPTKQEPGEIVQAALVEVIREDESRKEVIPLVAIPFPYSSEIKIINCNAYMPC